jgi:antitoxin MazE
MPDMTKLGAKHQIEPSQGAARLALDRPDPCDYIVFTPSSRRPLVKARIVRIGNSRGIRIPKPLIEQTGLTEDVEIVVQGNALVISPAGRARAGWGEAFRTMAARGDDRLLDEPRPTRWDEDEWRWR